MSAYRSQHLDMMVYSAVYQNRHPVIESGRCHSLVSASLALLNQAGRLMMLPKRQAPHHLSLHLCREGERAEQAPTPCQSNVMDSQIRKASYLARIPSYALSIAEFLLS